MAERLGGGTSSIEVTNLDDYEGFFDDEPREQTIQALVELYGDRVFTYKGYAGTVQDMADSCPAFDTRLDLGVDAAKDWLETHDGTPEDAPEDDDAEQQASVVVVGDDESSETPSSDVAHRSELQDDNTHRDTADSSPSPEKSAERVVQKKVIHPPKETDVHIDKASAESTTDEGPTDYDYVPMRETAAPRLPETKLEVHIPQIHPPLTISKEPTVLDEIKEELEAIDAAANERRETAQTPHATETSYDVPTNEGVDANRSNSQEIVNIVDRDYAQIVGGVAVPAAMFTGSSVVEKPMSSDAAVESPVDYDEQLLVSNENTEEYMVSPETTTATDDGLGEVQDNRESESTPVATELVVAERSQQTNELVDEISADTAETVADNIDESIDEVPEETGITPLLSDMFDKEASEQDDDIEQEQSFEDRELDGVELLHMVTQQILELDDDANDHTVKNRLADTLFGSPATVAEVARVLTKAQSSIEKLRRAKSAEECQDAIDELAQALEQLLQMAGYNHAHDIVRRLIRHHKIDELQSIIEYCLAVIQADTTQRQVSRSPRGLSRLAAYVLSLHRTHRPEYTA